MSAELAVVHSISSWLGQTLTWVHNQVRHLPEGVRASVVCDRTENLDQFPWDDLCALSDTGVRALLWKLTRLPQLHDGLLRACIEARGARIVHSHFGPRGYRDLAAVRRTCARHVVTFYGYDVSFVPNQHPSWRRRYQRLFRRVDRVLCEGPFMASSIAELGCPEEKIRVQRLGVELGALECCPRVWSPGEPLRVLIAASFREKKGIPDAFDALARLREHVPVEVTVIGDATREKRALAEKRAILAAIERSGLADRTRLLGYQPHRVMLEEAYAHHVFLSPSLTPEDGDTEGGAPVSLIEMSATGMPVVSTRHCDIPQVVEHGVTGLLAEERDVEDVAAQLCWLLEHPERWREMGEAGRRRVESRFDVLSQAEALAGIYRELLQ
ncbi:MAG: glycosyltransferase [Deltaproteobacteria bacterium]|nr:glycosyltransferase [Deltaproteobacteria bacterium]